MIGIGQKLSEVLSYTVSLLLFATVAPPRYLQVSFESFSYKPLHNQLHLFQRKERNGQSTSRWAPRQPSCSLRYRNEGTCEIWPLWQTWSLCKLKPANIAERSCPSWEFLKLQESLHNFLQIVLPWAGGWSRCPVRCPPTSYNHLLEQGSIFLSAGANFVCIYYIGHKKE